MLDALSMARRQAASAFRRYSSLVVLWNSFPQALAT
jgi:hypothetical protein